MFWLCISFWPIAFLAGLSAGIESRFFETISFFLGVLVIPCIIGLIGIWSVGIYRIFRGWDNRTKTLNFGYLMLLVFFSFLGGMIFCFVDDPDKSKDK